MTIEEDSILLEKYKDGKSIDAEDHEKIQELSAVGLIKTGISLRRKQVTSKTTPFTLGATELMFSNKERLSI